MKYIFCKHCKKRISSKSSTSFCDDVCKTSYENLPDKYCLNCNTQLDKVSNKIYCNIKCHNSHQKKNNLIDNTCVVCNKTYVIRKSKSHKLTCSDDCYKEYQRSEVRNKKRMDTLVKNNKSKHGVEYNFQRKDVIDSIKNTKEIKYGTSGYNNPEKRIKSVLEKYGTLDFSEKSKKTKIKKYGTLNVNEKANITKLAKYGTLDFSEKANATKLAKYGTLDFSELAKKTIIKKYGSWENYQKHLLQKKYDYLNKKYNDIVIFNFTGDSYEGAEKYKKYNFTCKVCNNIFDDYLTNGSAPLCPICNPRTLNKSSHEFEIIDWLYNIIPNHTIIHGDRSIIAPKEIDIYIPEFNLAIELNGVFWHTELNGKNKTYHIEKQRLCNNKNVKLLHILDREWKNSTDIVKSILYSSLGKSNRIFARQCTLKKIPNDIGREFLNHTHIQGDVAAKVYLGLFFKEELVSVMSFSKPRYNSKYEWEISRFSTKLFTTIVGGAGKLFNHFIQEYVPSSIISYSDKRLFTGNVYEKIGMVRLKDTNPSYHYVDSSGNLHNRVKFQKHKLKNLLITYDTSLSEWENMRNNGYDRIWDCGNYKFEWKRKDPLV